MSDWTDVGRHRVRVEGDVMHTEHRGTMSLAEYETMMGMLREAVQHRGVRYYVVNLTEAAPPTPEVRQRMSENDDELDVAIVAFGASWVMRTLTAMMQRAMKLLGKRDSSRFQLVATEADARAWIAQHRGRSS